MVPIHSIIIFTFCNVRISISMAMVTFVKKQLNKKDI